MTFEKKDLMPVNPLAEFGITNNNVLMLYDGSGTYCMWLRKFLGIKEVRMFKINDVPEETINILQFKQCGINFRGPIFTTTRKSNYYKAETTNKMKVEFSPVTMRETFRLQEVRRCGSLIQSQNG